MGQNVYLGVVSSFSIYTNELFTVALGVFNIFAVVNMGPAFGQTRTKCADEYIHVFDGAISVAERKTFFSRI